MSSASIAIGEIVIILNLSRWLFDKFIWICSSINSQLLGNVLFH